MKVVSAIIVFFVCNLVNAQSINFNSYANITNEDFKSLVSQFAQRTLPLSTENIIAEVNIWKINRRPLSSANVERYLKDGGELITGPLYSQQQDGGLPDVDIVGDFYPLYKLPTNGNYVLLTFVQVDAKSECSGLVFTLSFDLDGKFLYLSNYNYRPGTVNITSTIDATLKSHLYYVVKTVNGASVDPPRTQNFSAEEAHLTYQINSDGRSTKISFVKANYQFMYDNNECRFKRVN